MKQSSADDPFTLSESVILDASLEHSGTLRSSSNKIFLSDNRPTYVRPSNTLRATLQLTEVREEADIDDTLLDCGFKSLKNFAPQMGVMSQYQKQQQSNRVSLLQRASVIYQTPDKQSSTIDDWECDDIPLEASDQNGLLPNLISDYQTKGLTPMSQKFAA